MSEAYRIGVLTPYIHGEFFGEILSALYRVIQQHHSRLIAFQVGWDLPKDILLTEPLSFDYVDAWILILEPVNDRLLQLLEQSGKPILSISHRQSKIRCHSVLVDDRAGSKEAVLHLIHHGHRDIAFIGRISKPEFQERYLGYLEALQEYGIPFKEELVVNIPEGPMSESHAIAQLVERCGSYTAAIAITDLIAIELIDSLRGKGYSVPGDISVVGFDDIEEASDDTVSLTTVRQSFEGLSARAGEWIFSRLSGIPEEAGEDISLIPAQVVIRTSCGCPAPPEDPDKTFESYRGMVSRLRSELKRTTMEHNRLVKKLLKTTSSERIDLAGLYGHKCHWGCLALWIESSSGSKDLVVAQAYSTRGDLVPLIGQRIEIERFPPLDGLRATASVEDGNDLVIVQPIVTELHQWGYLALAGDKDEMIDPTFARELALHRYTMLTSGLEREMLFNRIRMIAEQLEIVSKTTNDGIWDWNCETGTIDWNDRVRAMLGKNADVLTDDPRSFLSMVRQQDRFRLMHAIKAHFHQNKPFQVEFRVQDFSGKTDQWLYAAGEAIRNSSGHPVRMIGSFTDITEKKQNEEHIVQLALHDSLTGLPNRRMFMERLQQGMELSKRNGMELAVIMMDLDRFKQVNDSMGHSAGDKLLQHVAEVLKESVRTTDTIARMGGDEFIILLSPIETVDHIYTITNRIMDHLSKPFTLERQRLVISSSIGVSRYPWHTRDRDELIKFADMAMYEAKGNGRNQVKIYSQVPCR